MSVDTLHDSLLNRPTDFEQMDRREYRLLDVTLSDVQNEKLLRVRLHLGNMIGGTRTALAILAYNLDQKQWPRVISAISPSYISKVPFDLYAWDAAFEQYDDFEYFVPIRDMRKDPRRPGKPHEIRVTLEEEEQQQQGTGELDAPTVSFSDFPMDAVDIQMGEIDTQRLREYFKSKIDQLPASQFEQGEIVQSVREMKSAGMTPGASGQELLDAIMEQSQQGAGGGSPMPMPMSALGGPLQDMLETALKQLLEDVFAVPSLEEVFTLVENGEDVPPDLAKQLLKEEVDAILRDEHVDPFMKLAQKLTTEMGADTAQSGQMIQSLIHSAEVSARREQQIAANSFTAEVDDSQFVLLSVGPDGVDQKAQLVGPRGTDILFWPPILSLQREHNREQSLGRR